MPTKIMTQKHITLHFDGLNKGSYRIRNTMLAATDQQLFDLAETINSVQEDTADRKSITETYSIA